MEALQILKLLCKQERLSFTGDLVAQEMDYVIEGQITARAIDELMAAGKYSELKELLSNSVPSDLPEDLFA
jgi:hypothetical protein